MRNVTPVVCAILLCSIIGCSHRPTDKRVDVKTTMLPEVAAGDNAFSSYRPAKAYAAYDNGILGRTVFQAGATAGSSIEVRDWKLAPGKQTAAIALPGAAFIEVRSGSAQLQAAGQTQELQLGAIVHVSQDEPFTITNGGQATLTMRVYVVTGS